MRNLKRVFSLALALVMVLGMMVIGTSAATFTDAEEITYTEAVEVMSALGILKGYETEDGFKFNPTGTLTRAEAAKILAYVCLGADAEEYLTGSAAPFTDVKATNWAAKFIAFCKNAKIINGVNAEQTVFNPAGTLKVVEFAKMLLVAIEAEGTFTGAGWEANVKAAVAKTEMAKTGIEITTEVITREEACELALAAMKSGGTTTRYYYVVDNAVANADAITSATTHGVYTDPADAYILQSIMTGVKVLHKDVTTGSLLDEVYGITFDSTDVDAYGRPAVSYKNGLPGAANITLVYADAPVKTYTTGFNAKEVLALEKAGYVLADNIVVNGVAADEGFDTVAELAGRNYVGTVIELYNTDAVAATIDKIVMIETYLAKVTDVKSDDVKVVTNNYVELTVYNPYDSDVGDADVEVIKYNNTDAKTPDTYDALVAAVAEGDMLLVQYQGGDTDTPKALLAFEAATSAKGTLTATTLGASYRGTIVVGGETYTMASAYAELAAVGGALTLGEEYTLYFDANGYVIGAVAKAPARPQVAVMTELALVENAANGSIGAKDSKYLEAEVVFFDGSKEIVKIEKLVHADETVFVADAGTDKAVKYREVIKTGSAQFCDNLATVQGYFKGDVVKYTVNEDGEYTFFQTTQNINDTDDTLAATALFNGVSVANNNTKFLIKTGTGKNIKYSVVTGYANLPVNAFTAGSVDATGIYAANSTVAGYVYLTGTDKTSVDDNKTIVFITGEPTNVYVDAQTSYYQYPAIIGGELTTLDVATEILDTGCMYKVLTLNAKGYVATVESVSKTGDIAVVAKDSIVKIDSAWNTYSTDTVVYVIDVTAGTVAAGDITKLEVGTDVFVTYVKAANGSNTPAIAQIIALENVPA